MQTETLSRPEVETGTALKSKVLLVDDHPIVRQGLGMLIDEEPDLIVCGQAEGIESALSAIANLKPDVVIVDIFLKEESGVDLIKQIHQRWPTLPMLVLSMHRETLHAERVLRAGAKGYIMKQEATQNIMRAIRQVLSGQIFVSERMASRLLSKAVDSSNPRGGGPLERLSDREFEVFTLIGQGLGPTEMSNRLSVSVKTIETHRENIKAKLALKNGTALVRYAMEYAMGEKLGREDEAPPAAQ